MSETENKKEKEYEMSYFLSADIPEDKVDDAAGGLNSLIAESGGKDVALEIPKRKWLSYKIKKRNEAYFGTAYFSISAAGLLKIKKSLTLNKNFLRYMILNKQLKPKPSAAVLAPEKLNNEPAPAPAQSFDQKLENILNR